MKKKKVLNIFLSLVLTASMIFGMTPTSLAAEDILESANVVEIAEDVQDEQEVTAGEENVVEENAALEEIVEEVVVEEDTTKETTIAELKAAPEIVIPGRKSKAIKLEGEDVSLRINNGNDEWASKVTDVVIDGVKLDPVQYEVKASNIVLKRTDDAPIFKEGVRETKTNITIKAEGYEDSKVEALVQNFGAHSFQVRVIGKDNKVYRIKTFSEDELSALQEEAMYNIACGSKGLRTYKAKGVKIENLLKSAGLDLNDKMTFQFRCNDSMGVTKNDDLSDDPSANAYSWGAKLTYDELFATPRYFFNGIYGNEEVTNTILNSENWGVETRTAIGGVAKTKVEPMIGMQFVGKVFKETNGEALDNATISRLSGEEGFRLLFGLALDPENENVVNEQSTTNLSSKFVFGLDIIDPDFEFVTPTVSSTDIDRTASDFRIPLEGNADLWEKRITSVKFNGEELTEDQYGLFTNRWGTSFVLKRTEDKPLVSGKDRETKATLVVEADGYETLDTELTLKNYGADSFEIRVIKKDADGKVTERIPVRKFSWEELEAMKEKNPVYFQTGCGSAKMRSFKAEGVYIENLMKAAGIVPTNDMDMIIRVGDCVGPEDGRWTNPDGHRGTFNYGDLMNTDRYFFDGLYDDPEVLKSLNDTSGKFTKEDTRRALAKTNKSLVKPVIALRYVEQFYDDGNPKNSDTPFSKIIEDEKAMRFLFGMKIEKDEKGDIVEANGHTSEASYMTFGIDIVDNDYANLEDNETGVAVSGSIGTDNKLTVKVNNKAKENKIKEAVEKLFDNKVVENIRSFNIKLNNELKKGSTVKVSLPLPEGKDIRVIASNENGVNEVDYTINNGKIEIMVGELGDISVVALADKKVVPEENGNTGDGNTSTDKKPSDNNKPSDNKKPSNTNTPQTGDTVSFGIYVAILAFALLCIAGTVVYKKKH